MKFLHVAARANLASIMANGLRPGSYLVLDDRTEISDFYAETVTDEGQVPVVIEVDASNLPPENFAPDTNSIEEPLTHTLQMTEDDVQEAWAGSGCTWLDSIEIIGTCRYMNAIPTACLHVQGEPTPEPQPAVAPRRARP